MPTWLLSPIFLILLLIVMKENTQTNHRVQCTLMLQYYQDKTSLCVGVIHHKIFRTWLCMEWWHVGIYVPNILLIYFIHRATRKRQLGDGIIAWITYCFWPMPFFPFFLCQTSFSRINAVFPVRNVRFHQDTNASIFRQRAVKQFIFTW